MSDFLTILASCEGPWLFKTSNISELENMDGVIHLNGKKMISFDGFYNEISKAFEFPDYFGNNFNALSEMLSDLSWLPQDKYLILIKDGEKLLSVEAQDARDGFLELLAEIGKEWSQSVNQGQEWDRPSIPFYSIIQFNAMEASSFLAQLPNISNPSSKA